MKNRNPRFTSLAIVPLALALCSAAASVSSCSAEFEVRCPDGTEQTAGGGDVNKACGTAAGAGGAAGPGGGPGAGNAGQGGTSGGPQGGNGGEGGQPLVCAGEDRACDRACVDVRVSNQHCGECNKACSGTCQAGACVPVTQLALGGVHSCALLADGTAKCWGSNIVGQLGNGTILASLAPATVKTSEKLTKIAVGTEHSCAVTEQKRLVCWGNNADVRLGLSVSQEGYYTEPKAVTSLAGVDFIGAAGRQTCAVGFREAEYATYCFGSDEFGALGDGAATGAGPFAAAGLGDKSIVAGGANFVCAAGNAGSDGGQLHCWGRNNKGQLLTSASAA